MKACFFLDKYSFSLSQQWFLVLRNLPQKRRWRVSSPKVAVYLKEESIADFSLGL